ncbi:MAG: hypothetical protein V4541_08220 [Bacteroidota bacterium]
MTKCKTYFCGVCGGLYHKDLVVGDFLNFGTFFHVPPGAEKGTTWNTTEGSAKNTFTVREINALTTTVTFKSEASDPGINSTLNGLAVIDNATGVCLKRLVKVSIISNQKNGDKTFQTAANYVVSEVCTKIE